MMIDNYYDTKPCNEARLDQEDLRTKDTFASIQFIVPLF